MNKDRSLSSGRFSYLFDECLHLCDRASVATPDAASDLPVDSLMAAAAAENEARAESARLNAAVEASDAAMREAVAVLFRV
jgi:hypothetical protein